MLMHKDLQLRSFWKVRELFMGMKDTSGGSTMRKRRFRPIGALRLGPPGNDGHSGGVIAHYFAEDLWIKSVWNCGSHDISFRKNAVSVKL